MLGGLADLLVHWVRRRRARNTQTCRKLSSTSPRSSTTHPRLTRSVSGSDLSCFAFVGFFHFIFHTLLFPCRMSQPFKMVTLAPYLALQGCLACESRMLSYENLMAGLKFMAKTTLFCHTIVGVIWCLCEELIIHSSDWNLQDWRLLFFLFSFFFFELLSHLSLPLFYRRLVQLVPPPRCLLR